MPPSASRTSETTQSHEIVIERHVNAPRDLVFATWTDPEHIKRWWGPEGFTITYCAIDLEPGGKFHFCMRSPEGQNFWVLGVYQEIHPPERLVYIDSFSDEDGNVVPAEEYGFDGTHPLETLITVTFAEIDGGTDITVRQTSEDMAPEVLEGSNQGWNQMLDSLEGYLAA